jgi:hypothetical protein
LHIPDKPLLDVPPVVEIQMQINHGGLYVIMTQVVLDVGYGMASIEHVHSPAMTETVYGIDVFKPLGRKGLLEILFADAVDAMASEFFSPLIEKEPVLI